MTLARNEADLRPPLRSSFFFVPLAVRSLGTFEWGRTRRREEENPFVSGILTPKDECFSGRARRMRPCGVSTSSWLRWLLSSKRKHCVYDAVSGLFKVLTQPSLPATCLRLMASAVSHQTSPPYHLTYCARSLCNSQTAYCRLFWNSTVLTKICRRLNGRRQGSLNPNEVLQRIQRLKNINC